MRTLDARSCRCLVWGLEPQTQEDVRPLAMPSPSCNVVMECRPPCNAILKCGHNVIAIWSQCRRNMVTMLSQCGYNFLALMLSSLQCFHPCNSISQCRYNVVTMSLQCFLVMPSCNVVLPIPSS